MVRNRFFCFVVKLQIDNTLMAITSQHNFVLYDAQFSRIKQMIGK